MSRSLRVIVADDERYMRDYLQELLPRLGHQVAAAENGRQLVELCRAFPPDLVIADIKMGDDLDGIAAAAEVNRAREVPVILVSAHHDAELRARAREGGRIMAYLVKPVKQADLEAAIDLALSRFEELRALRKESADLRQALEDRKVVERAKGVLMKRLAVAEDEAFRRLRRLASDHNHKASEVARRIVASDEIFQALEAV